MKRSIREIGLRAVILVIGLMIAHLGVTLFLIADLGSDPFNVLVQGIFSSMQKLTAWNLLTHGRVHICMCFIIIIVLLFVDRSYIKLGTVICMILGGPIIDLFMWLLSPALSLITALPLKIFMLAIGCVILAYGMTIVIKSDAGTGPNDLVGIVVSDKLHKKFSVTRIITDALFVIIGFILGGTFGLGTIVCVVLVGPTAGLFLPMNEKLVNKVMANILKR